MGHLGGGCWGDINKICERCERGHPRTGGKGGRGFIAGISGANRSTHKFRKRKREGSMMRGRTYSSLAYTCDQYMWLIGAAI